MLEGEFIAVDLRGNFIGEGGFHAVGARVEFEGRLHAQRAKGEHGIDMAFAKQFFLRGGEGFRVGDIQVQLLYPRFPDIFQGNRLYLTHIG